MSTRRAIVLLSGGIDSAVALAHAQHQGCECYALSVDYAQRHRAELDAARRIASQRQVQHRIVPLNLRVFGGSALTSDAIEVPCHRAAENHNDVPLTYVPARNTIFLALALAWAEVAAAHYIYIGANAVDYSGYPDCRPEYLAAFQQMADLATKAALDGARISVQAPLIHLTKAQIIEAGYAWGVDFAATVSCYQADAEGRACGSCDACSIRRRGFEAANIVDPTRYQTALA
jgi:7-cyano-7-deazaguanine synthase